MRKGVDRVSGIVIEVIETISYNFSNKIYRREKKKKKKDAKERRRSEIEFWNTTQPQISFLLLQPQMQREEKRRRARDLSQPATPPSRATGNKENERRNETRYEG